MNALVIGNIASEGGTMITSGLNDGELLKRFNQRDNAAFEELLRRHASLVAKVCRRITQNAHDAEDAMQKVFAALAARAATLVEHPSIAGWLYTTAWHISLDARRQNIRRRANERSAAVVDDLQHGCALERAEALYELYRAIGMLPVDYRLMIVLHHLEGMTLAEVARVTRQPLGTVAAGISRGRAMIRERMARRGEVLSVAGLTGMLSDELEVVEIGPVSISDLLPGDEIVLPPSVELKGVAAAGQTAALATSTVGSGAVSPMSAGAILFGLLQGRAAIASVTLLTLTGIAAASPSARQWVAEKTGFAQAPEKPNEKYPRPPAFLDFSFGGGSGHRTVPEPGTFSLAAFGGYWLLRRRR